MERNKGSLRREGKPAMMVLGTHWSFRYQSFDAKSLSIRQCDVTTGSHNKKAISDLRKRFQWTARREARC